MAIIRSVTGWWRYEELWIHHIAPWPGRAGAQSVPTRGLMCSKWSGFHTGCTGYTRHTHGSFLGLLPHSDQIILTWTHLGLNRTSSESHKITVFMFMITPVSGDGPCVILWASKSFLQVINEVQFLMIQTDECQKGRCKLHRFTSVWIKLLIKSDDWVWMLGPGRHWVGMTNVGLTSH